MAKDENKKGLVAEFKAFIARGNVLDMAVGVIIGAAFNAIVNSLVSILMSVATWPLPGGIKGLVTVLPAVNDLQKGLNPGIGLDQDFAASDLHELATKLAASNYTAQEETQAAAEAYVKANPATIESAKTTILSKYTLHGAKYTYNLSAVIDWGAFINAIISFLVIALTLFVIVKVAMKMSEKRAELQDKITKKNEEEPKQE